ncbi:MAG: ribonuclease P protein component [Candidatus Baltobacteraceae bacterium]
MRWYESLRRPREFAAVRRRGRRERRSTIDVFAVDRPGARPRVGVTVGKAVGNAVIRNLVRRRIHGALAPLGEAGAAPAVDLVFIAAPAAATAPFARLAAEVASAVQRIALAPGR